MHLSSITIKGFKSFPERTRLVFSPGVSVIVGPNGCGKSNITDAVLWSMGEQSPLAVRGQSMQDMIFAGGDGRIARAATPRWRSSSTTATATAATFSEISVRRRLDRNGEGEYRLNGARCRLVDVIEALADANLGREMHSVISQGRVEEIVHSRPRERRLLVEEAAGLGKHRKRRRRAQLKLERTQDNLDRALDVEREARSRLRPLKRQAQAADIHARLEREAAELRGRLLAERASRARDRAVRRRAPPPLRRARRARRSRPSSPSVAKRRTEIEERLADRDRERTAELGRLTATRAAHERLSVRAEALAARRGELAAELERERAALGALAEEAAQADEGDDPVGSEPATDRRGARRGHRGASQRAAPPRADSEPGRATSPGCGTPPSAPRGGARRVEGLLGKRRQGSLEGRIVAATAAARAPRRPARGRGRGPRRRRRARRRAGAPRCSREGDAEDVHGQLRECSQAEAELQASLHAAAEIGDRGRGPGGPAARPPRRGGRASSSASASVLGREVEPAEETLDAEEREEIERKLERLARRREALGPVNPLAEREYARGPRARRAARPSSARTSRRRWPSSTA